MIVNRFHKISYNIFLIYKNYPDKCDRGKYGLMLLLT